MATCSSCRFFIAEQGADPSCRRFPPTSSVMIVPRKESVLSQNVVPVKEQSSHYPIVKPDWWCGEYATRLASAA